MLWTYVVFDKTFGSIPRWLSMIGKKDDIYIYKVNSKTSFFVRKGMLDSYIIFENWSQRIYTNGSFSIKPTDTVVDIGAQIGSFSIYASKLAQNGKVYSFEPHPENFELLKRNKKLNRAENLTVFNEGVSDRKGEGKLFLSATNSGGHSIVETDTKNFITFKTTTLPEIIKSVGRINFLKIDAEGAEYPILLNCKQNIFDRIDKIVLEYHDYFGQDHNYLELVTLLKKMGYKISLGTNVFSRKIFGLGTIKAWR